MSKFENQVRLTWSPHQAKFEQWEQTVSWCIDTFGWPEIEDTWSATANIEDMEFEFRDAKDCSLFVLKMGGRSCTVLS